MRREGKKVAFQNGTYYLKKKTYNMLYFIFTKIYSFSAQDNRRKDKGRMNIFTV